MLTCVNKDWTWLCAKRMKFLCDLRASALLPVAQVGDTRELLRESAVSVYLAYGYAYMKKYISKGY